MENVFKTPQSHWTLSAGTPCCITVVKAADPDEECVGIVTVMMNA